MTVIDPHIVMGDTYEEIIQKFVNKLRESAPVRQGEIILPGDDRIEYKKSHAKL